ncbi:MAG: Leucine-tRNA ligase, partial [Candidatus Peregrinibacteria bacterium GW2011_GWA2_54_9]
KSERERQENKEKTGVELKGVKAINPVNGEELPIWTADYVLAHYGTGAVMAVPAHDQRDFEFAQKFKLPITIVVCPHYPEKTCPVLDEAYEGEGHLVASGQFDGLPSAKAKEEIVKWLSQKGLAEKKISYKLRDWIFSRQRYWGEPIPIIKCEKCGNQPVPEEDLPVELPKVKNYEPTGEAESPLAGIKKWVNVKCPKCGGSAKRETNTMPQWAGSCWYYLAYIMRGTSNFQLTTSNAFSYWLPVDLYVGGVEHAVLHLLYVRFWHKFLYDIGVVGTKEPFQKLVNQGLILGPDNQKMSKSRGNVINPDDLVKEFGADSLRLYEMFIGPLEDAKPWQTEGIIGVHRFLSRVYNLISKIKNQKSKLQIKNKKNTDKIIHQTIKKVTEDIQNFRFNTAISAMMILLNELEKQPESVVIGHLSLFIRLLFPFAPHLAQECWEMIGSPSIRSGQALPRHPELS